MKTIKEKAKAYDESLFKARNYYPNSPKTEEAKRKAEMLEDLFPELAESEDERIRKEIIDAIHNYARRLEEKIPTKWIAWLQKQGEQKSIEYNSIKWTEEEDRYIRELENLVRERWAKAEVEKDKLWIEKMSNLFFFLKTIKKCEQKPVKWSEEDTERYESCLKRLGTGNPGQPETINSKWFKEHIYLRPKQEWSEEDRNKIADYLYCLNVGFTQAAAKQRAKDICDLLCPQNQWKPTEEQMKVLSLCNVSGLMLQQEDVLVLKSLYEDLKALLL